jgi:hypothetical protein
MNKQPVIQYRGDSWRLSEPTRTSDGFWLATGFLLDPETMEPVKDESGFPVFHSFFLGGGVQ